MRAEPSPERFRQLMLTEEPSLENVLSCVFDIQEHEARTYLTLLERPGNTVEELATELDRDRSNINRSLSTLRNKTLAERERRLIEGGGHVYQYNAVSLSEARDLMHETLDEWAAYVHERIDEFGSIDS
jgi:predicted transcriptional regulator